jgi:hypothetical protein
MSKVRCLIRLVDQAQADVGGMANGKACTGEGGGKVSECRKCTVGACSHGAQCPMMIRWYDDPWDGTFWRRCECTTSIHAAVYPVTVSRVAKRC